MNKRILTLTALAGSLGAASAVTAGFSGLNLIVDYRGPNGVWDDHGYAMTGLTTYRLYANFDGLGDDGILAVFGQPGDPMVIQSSDGMFHNDPLGGLTAPLDLTGAGIWQNQWDTYVTIGATTSVGDATGLSPGFATETNSLATNWSTDNAGWFVTPADPQGAGTDVLLAQFVVAVGESVGGSINILTRDNETFKGIHSDPPAPGAIGLLAIAGLRASRRRRQHPASGRR